VRTCDIACSPLRYLFSRVNRVINKPPGRSAKTKKSPYFAFYAWPLFIVTGWLGIVGIWEYSAHLLASQGQVVTATVTGKVLHPAGQEGYSKTSYEEDFAFTTAAGQRVEGKTDVSADHWDRIKIGDTFKVTHVTSEPGTYHIGTDTSTTVSDGVFVGVLLIWLLFLTLTIRSLHRRPTHRMAGTTAPNTAADAPPPAAARAQVSGPVLMGTALLVVGGAFLLIGVANLVTLRSGHTHGRAATAIVLTKSTVTGKNGDSYPLDVRFTTEEGKSIETSIGVDYATMTSLHEHFPIKIIYAPEHPDRIWLANDDLFTTFVMLWFVSALGGILAIGGMILMSFGFLDAKRERVLHPER
jgi:hypothetical protein